MTRPTLHEYRYVTASLVVGDAGVANANKRRQKHEYNELKYVFYITITISWCDPSHSLPAAARAAGTLGLATNATCKHDNYNTTTCTSKYKADYIHREGNIAMKGVPAPHRHPRAPRVPSTSIRVWSSSIAVKVSYVLYISR
jgi:hypothetical protein